jgi:hypothetical protein
VFLGCNDDPRAVAVIRKWDAFEFEGAGQPCWPAQATIVCSADEFLQSECHYLASLPLVHIEKLRTASRNPFREPSQTVRWRTGA